MQICKPHMRKFICSFCIRLFTLSHPHPQLIKNEGIVERKHQVLVYLEAEQEAAIFQKDEGNVIHIKSVSTLFTYIKSVWRENKHERVELSVRRCYCVSIVFLGFININEKNLIENWQPLFLSFKNICSVCLLVNKCWPSQGGLFYAILDAIKRCRKSFSENAVHSKKCNALFWRKRIHTTTF